MLLNYVVKIKKRLFDDNLIELENLGSQYSINADIIHNANTTKNVPGLAEDMKSLMQENLGIPEEMIIRKSFFSIEDINEVKEDFLKPFLVINPIFKPKKEIELIDIIRSSSIGYMHID